MYTGSCSVELLGTQLTQQPQVSHLIYLCLISKMGMKVPIYFTGKLQILISQYVTVKGFGDFKCYINVLINFECYGSIR